MSSKEIPVRRNIHAELIAHLLNPGEVWIVNTPSISARVAIEQHERSAKFSGVRALDEAYDVWGQKVEDMVSIVGTPITSSPEDKNIATSSGPQPF